MKTFKKIKAISLVLMIALVAQVLVFQMDSVDVKAASAKSIYSSVSKAYGQSFPLSSSNLVNVQRKNIFGGYSKVLGVSAKYFKSYKVAKKVDSSQEYVCAIFKATKKKNVKKIKKALNKYVKNEKTSNLNYFSSTGKSLLENAKVGSKGKYVYLFILDTSKNQKAVNAFKKNS